MPESDQPPTVILTTAAGVAEVVLNRPDKMNAMNGDMVRELMQSLDAVFRTITMKSFLLQGKLNHLSRNTFIVHNQSPMW